MCLLKVVTFSGDNFLDPLSFNLPPEHMLGFKLANTILSLPAILAMRKEG